GRRGGRWRTRENGAEAPSSDAADAADAADAGFAPESQDRGDGATDIFGDGTAAAPAATPPIAETPAAAAAVEPAAAAEPEPARELEPVAAGNGAEAEAEHAAEPAPGGRPAPQPPEGVDVHAVTEKPAAPRRGWWNRLIQ
ncbi:MAG: hypothetical protein JO258_07750, partial [Alphaproteobacteria bacterium]|nr:hypothetical protein [Alphaproteobacteria bacterium]